MLARRFAIVLALGLFVGLRGSSAFADISEVAITKERLSLAPLRAGGFVIFLRHALTDVKNTDRTPPDFADCATQRNLSDAGKAQAKSIGESIARLGIPIGLVLSSPLCRSLDTARLAFPDNPIGTRTYLASSSAYGPATRQEMTKDLLRELGTKPEVGTNTVIVSHSFNLKDATGLWLKPEGAAFIFAPQDDGSHRLMGHVAPNAWEKTFSAPKIKAER